MTDRPGSGQPDRPSGMDVLSEERRRLRRALDEAVDDRRQAEKRAKEAREREFKR